MLVSGDKNSTIGDIVSKVAGLGKKTMRVLRSLVLSNILEDNVKAPEVDEKYILTELSMVKYINK